MSARTAAKDAARAVAATVAPRLWRMTRQPRLLILMYHRVLPRTDAARQFEQPGMIVAPETLAMHLRILRSHFELVHLADWVQQAEAGELLPDRACAITFDDGWRDNHTYAYPVLHAARAPATIFLVSRLVGQSYGFWPTSLARLLHAAWTRGDETTPRQLALQCPDVAVPGSVPAHSALAAVDDLLVALKQHYADEQMLRVTAELQQMTGNASERELMTWEEVEEMRASGLIAFGSHTCTHTRLRPELEMTKAAWEIDQSALDLTQRLGDPPVGFCYPNGDHTPATVELARRRYAFAVTTRAGWNRRDSDRMLLRRVGVHDDVSDTPTRFIARLALGL